MSLRDQLLKSGIATKKQHQNVRSQKKKQTKNNGKQVSGSAQNSVNSLAEERARRDRELNQAKERERHQKAQQAQIKQLVDTNKVIREAGETPYRFTHNKRVKTLYFSEMQVEKIISGFLAIATLGEDDYYLIPAAVAEKILEKSPESIVVNNKKVENSDNGEEEDPYADYEIPDDLMW